jgi:hypothetical protein
MPSPPLGRVWRQRSSEVGIFHSGGFAEYVSGGFVHFTSGDDIKSNHPMESTPLSGTLTASLRYFVQSLISRMLWTDSFFYHAMCFDRHSV